MPSLAQIANNSVTVSFQWADETVTLDYYPGHITAQLIGQFNAIKMDSLGNVVSGFETLNAILAGIPATETDPEQSGLLKTWNAFEDDEQTIMIPITVTRLARLPLPFLMQCLYTVMGDIRPNMIAGQTPN